MNEQSQRIAIATFCGWQAIELRDSIKSGQKDWLSGLNPKPDQILKVIDIESGEERAPNESDYGYETLPDYLRDLNAINDAERSLDQTQELAYRCELQDMFPFSMHSPTMAIRAIASQRAEAILRAIGEWMD